MNGKNTTNLAPERAGAAIRFDPADGATPAPVPRVRSAMALAAEWGIKRSTMRKWLRDGRLKGRKIDRLWLVDLDDFARFWREEK